jgi:hypothetical protein
VQEPDRLTRVRAHVAEGLFAAEGYRIMGRRRASLARATPARAAHAGVPLALRSRAGGHMKIIGILLVAIGIIGLAYGGLSWTKSDKVIDMGPVEVTHEKTKSLPIPPIAGAVCLVAGAWMLVSTTRKTA